MRTPAPKPLQWVGLIVGLCFLIFGGIMLKKHLAERRLGRQTLEWYRAEGIMMRSAPVYYRYVINGQVYFSDRVTSTKKKAEKDTDTFARSHPMGSPVTVYYNPSNLAEAVIIPGPDSDNRLFIITWAAIIVVGLFAVQSSIRDLIRLSRPVKPLKQNV